MAKSLNVKSFVIFSPYLNKKNWFGSSEQKHMAVHLADYMELSAMNGLDSKKNYLTSYRKLTPELILPDLQKFLSSI
jgi:heptosyltransferase-2